jgi:hypothetical protein
VSEADLYPAILAAHSRGDTRLLRINAGLAWQGTVIEHTRDRLILAHPRPVKLANEGVSDLLGWTMANDIAVFTAIECKFGRAKPTPAQQSFIDTVRRMGGRAGIARSVEEAGRIIQGEI